MPQSDSFEVSEEESKSPESQLDIYQQIIDSGADDEFLERTNVGLGNYTKDEYWQQVESFRNGMFASSAFGRRLRERAIEETKRELAKNGWSLVTERNGDRFRIEIDGWDDLDDEKKEDLTLSERAESVWADLGEDEQIIALQEVTGISREWVPPHLRMLMMRHEGSRSIDARLMDNAFGRVQEREIRGDTDEVSKSRLERLRGES